MYLFNRNDMSKVEAISNKFFELKNKIKTQRQINKFLKFSKKEIENIFKIKIEYLIM